MNSPAQLVVFTDLDGTLLDHDSYDFSPALPALALLRRLQIPLVFCTSKTAAETCELRTAIANTDPFIPENGSGVFIPAGCFSFPFAADRTALGCQVIELGSGYAALSAALVRVMQQTGLQLRGFSMMDEREVAGLCGFSIAQAALAKQRFYDEPFVLAGGDVSSPAVDQRLAAAAADLGFRITRGGRFFHLTGANDKGRAVRLLAGLYRRRFGAVYTAALGDSANDEPMLREADAAVLLTPKNSPCVPELKNAAFRYGSPGPAGWNQAVLQLLDERQQLSSFSVAEGRAESDV